ncbi:MAG: hypothetical protein GY854_12115 [Deltaproteobacteria bacterium]|nr:hypothetical protein [Deltaproteobacteria bacterium]
MPTEKAAKSPPAGAKSTRTAAPKLPPAAAKRLRWRTVTIAECRPPGGYSSISDQSFLTFRGFVGELIFDWPQKEPEFILTNGETVTLVADPDVEIDDYFIVRLCPGE